MSAPSAILRAARPDPAARHRAAVDAALERARRGEPWDPAALRFACGDRLDELAATVGLCREHAGGPLGRECDDSLVARVRRALP